jgi:uncharacterized SAM-binding protein YcdF (DUF218 family)
MIRRLFICCLLVSGLAASVAAMMYLSRGWWLNAMGHWLVVNEQPVKSDAIVAVSGENRRRRYAIELYKRGFADRLIFNVSDTTYYFGKAIDPVASVLDNLEEAGIPRLKAIINRDVGSTWQDAGAALENVRDIGFNSLIVVSDPFNMRRVKMTYDRVLAGEQVRITYCSLPLEWEKIELDQWWTREREFLDVFNEYLKICFYWFKYF